MFNATFKLCFVSFTVKGNNSAPSVTNSQSERRPPLKSSAPFDNVLRWLSSLQIARNAESELTLNFSETSGYRSMIDLDLDTEAEILE